MSTALKPRKKSFRHYFLIFIFRYEVHTVASGEVEEASQKSNLRMVVVPPFCSGWLV